MLAKPGRSLIEYCSFRKRQSVMWEWSVRPDRATPMVPVSVLARNSHPLIRQYGMSEASCETAHSV